MSNCGCKQCPHGMCLNHNPEWAVVKEAEYLPNPISILGILWYSIYATVRCCGKPMRRMKKIRLVQCKKCGRTKEEILDDEVGFCECCGFHKHVAIFKGDRREE